ncbi:MAG: DUF1501 domain-containing protein [Pirellulales bacterium]
MTPLEQSLEAVTRRELFQRTGCGVGGLALASLLAHDGFSAAPTSTTKRADALAPRAKNVIAMHMVGAPSQLELFDHKPELIARDGEPIPQSFIEGKRFAFIKGQPTLMGTKFKFQKCGQSGLMISELLPHLQKQADDICIVKTLHTEEFNHGPAQLFMQTGSGRFGRPSFGAWSTYGLGSENENLPGFVVMLTGKMAGGGSSLWGSGFLPTVYQGIEFRTSGDPVLFLSNPAGITNADRARTIASLGKLNGAQLAEMGDPEIATRIAQYELAYRMQTSVPELMDISDEPEHIHKLYGTTPGKPSFANNCLLARRLIERGVRFVQLYDADWDHHGSVFTALPRKCKDVDQAMAALVADLRQRGLLDETLVTWGGEFGRTPMSQQKSNDDKPNAQPGRDHHKDAFCVWMAGGGVKGGVTYGETDDFGFNIVRDPMHVNDYHATLLRLLGLDHERLTFKFQGRNFRLTDVAGKVATKILV